MGAVIEGDKDASMCYIQTIDAQAEKPKSYCALGDIFQCELCLDSGGTQQNPMFPVGSSLWPKARGALRTDFHGLPRSLRHQTINQVAQNLLALCLALFGIIVSGRCA